MSDVKNKRVVIFIDQAAAEDALGRLQVKADGFNAKIENARKSQEKLLEQIKKGAAAGEDVKKLETRYNELGIKINGYTKSLKETGDAQLKIKQQIDNGISPSLKQMENYVSRLRNELRNFNGTQEELAAKSAIYKKAAGDLDVLRASIFGVANAQRNWLQEAKTVAFGVLIGNTIQSAIGAVTGYISGIVSGNAKMSDSLAKVQQTTGLATDEIRELAKELKQIDTRTAQSDLLKIAEIGGQFNVPKEDLRGFVEQIDKANVVLGTEFTGGAEQITTELALLRNVFVDIKGDHIDQDLGHIGNALVVLAQEGAATAPVVSDFAKRLSPLISTAKLTSGEILGLSATMQELAINPERGGTAVVKLFDKMISNAKAFANVAGIGIKEFKDQLRDNPFAAFQKVLEGFKKGGADVVALNAVIQDLETSGVGAKEVLVKLSQNTDLLAQRSATATESLTKTDKITQQFAVNNATLGAEMDKLSKRFSALITSSGISNFITSLVKSFSELISSSKTATEKATELGDAFKKNETKLLPAIDTYNELSKKTNLSKEENIKLKESLDIIASTMPTAITQFDNYGNAIEVSTQKAKDFLFIQKLLFQKENAKAIQEQTVEYKRLFDLINSELNALQRGTKSFSPGYGGKTVQLPFTNEDIIGIQNNIKSANESIQATFAKGLQLNNLPITYAAQLPEALDKINAIEKTFGIQQANSLRKLLSEFKVEEVYKQLNITTNKVDPQKTKTDTTNNKPIVLTDDAEQKKREDLLNKIKAFQFELEQVGKQADEKQIDQIKHKYEALIKEAVQYGLNVINLEKEKDRAVAFLLQEEQNKINAYFKKLNKESDEEQYKDSIQAAIDSGEDKKQLLLQQYADRLIDKKQLESELRQTDIDTLDFQIAIAQTYADDVLGNVKKADDDLVQFKKKKNKEQIDDKIKTNEQLAADAKLQNERDKASILASAQLGVANSPEGSKQNLNARITLLKIQRDQELAATNITEEQKALIIKEYQEKISNEQIAFYKDRVDVVLGYVQTALGILDQFNQARNNREKAVLDKELKANDAKRKSIENLAKSEVITEQEKQKRLAALDAEDQKKKEELEKKQQVRSKKIAIAQAIINGALAVTNALATVQPFIPAAIIAAGIATASTIAQVAVISSTKYEKGGITKGAKHSQGGINMIDTATGHKVGEMEGGEPYMILSDNTYKNNKPIVDSLLHSSMYKNGAPVLPQWQSRAYQPLDYTGATKSILGKRFFKDGGTFNTDGSSGTDTQATTQVVVQSDPELKAMLNLLIRRLNEPIEANISLKKIQDADTLQSDILEQATFK